MHVITIRTHQAALWMLPRRTINRIIGGILARYQEIFGIVIYAYSVQGNHYHLLVLAPLGHLDEFLENVNREIARRINWHYNREGRFWGRRYDDQVVPCSNDALEAFLYVVTNPTKHGLARHPNKWPGLNCYRQVLDGEDRRYKFTHYSASTKGKIVESEHSLKLTPLPQFAHLSHEERRKLLLKYINERVALLNKEREEKGGGYATIEMLMRQKPGSRPTNIARSPRPLCYSKEPEIIKRFRVEAALLRQRYTIASFEYRGGNKDVRFPSFTFKPPLHRKPRLIPFGHLLERKAA